MKNLSILSMILALTVSLNVTASVAQNYSAPYLLFSNSVEAAGYGEAYTTLANDASASFWNPAGLTQVTNFSFAGASVLAMQYDRQFSAASGAYYLDGVGTVALAASRSGVADIQQYDANGQYIRDFDATNMVFGLSFARNVTESLSIGVTGRYINQDLFVKVDNGYALDLGLRLDRDIFAVGMVLQNLVGEVGPDVLPTVFRAGVSVRPIQGLVTAVDIVTDDIADAQSRRFANFGIGYEFDMADAVLVPRAGFHNGALSLGAGIGYNMNDLNIRIDYAFVNEPSDLFGTTHRVGLIVNGL